MVFKTMLALKAALDETDPRLWPVLIAGVVYSIGLLWKRYAPKSFRAVPARFKALPAAIIGAVLAGSTGTSTLIDLFIGAAAGLTAVGGHETMKRLKTGVGSSDVPPCAACAAAPARRPARTPDPGPPDSSDPPDPPQDLPGIH